MSDDDFMPDMPDGNMPPPFPSDPPMPPPGNRFYDFIYEPDGNEQQIHGDPAIGLIDEMKRRTAGQDTDRTLSYLTVRQAAEKYGRQERQIRRWIMSLHPEQRMESPLRGLESALDELVENRQDTRTGHQQDTVLHEVITRDDPEWMKAQINSLNVQALSLTQALQTATRELESAHAERRSAIESLTAIQGELESARGQLRLLQERLPEAPESPNTGVTAPPDKSIGRWFRRLFGATE
jgi:DNA repair exonuclease SbcCD ATPase subunit